MLHFFVPFLFPRQIELFGAARFLAPSVLGRQRNGTERLPCTRPR